MNHKTSLLLALTCAFMWPLTVSAAPKPKLTKAKKVVMPQVEYCLLTLTQRSLFFTLPGGSESEESVDKRPGMNARGVVASRLWTLARNGWRVVACAGDSNETVWTLERRR